MKKSIAVAGMVCALVGWSARDTEAQTRGSAGAGERFVVSGVIVFEHEGGLAWMREPSLTGDRVVAVRVAESIGPYRVTKILEDRVELEGPGGTVLVPVYNAEGGPGLAVAQAVPAEGSAKGRAGRADVQQDVANSPAAPALSASSALQALRDRLEAAKRTAERAERDPRKVDPQSGVGSTASTGSARRSSTGGSASGGTSSGSVSAAGASPSSASASGTDGGGAPSPTASSAPATPPGNTGDSNVLYPVKRDTFQSILGLK